MQTFNKFSNQSQHLKFIKLEIRDSQNLAKLRLGAQLI